MKMRNIILKTFAILFILVSCSKNKESETPKWQKCSIFDLKTNSGYDFKVTNLPTRGTLWDVHYLKFNSDNIVIDTSRMSLDARDVKTFVSKEECFPSYIQ